MGDIVSALGANSAGAAQTKSQKDLDNFIGTREDFLNILLAQLKHQDPLEPMKGTEFIDSLTRLSSVEQAVNTNSHLEKIEKLLGAGDSNFGTPVSYLDKTVEFLTPALALKNGEAQFSYNLSESPQSVYVVIKDIDGKTVRSTSEGGHDIGKNIIKWDGRDDSGNKVPDGEYFVSVDYVMKSGGALKNVQTATSGVVTGAKFEDGNTLLLVGNIKAKIEDVIAVHSLSGV